MPRAYRAPFGTAGAFAMSVPPVLLCFLSMSLANQPTKLVSLAAIIFGLIVYGTAELGRKRALKRQGWSLAPAEGSTAKPVQEG